MKNFFLLVFICAVQTEIFAQNRLASAQVYSAGDVSIVLNESDNPTVLSVASNISLFGSDDKFSLWENFSQRKLYDFSIEGFDFKSILKPDGKLALFFYKREIDDSYTNGAILDIQTGKLSIYSLPLEYPDFSDKRFTWVFDNDNLYITSVNKLWSLDFNNLKARLITALDLPDNSYEDVLFSTDNSIYISVTADPKKKYSYGYSPKIAEREVVGVFKYDVLSGSLTALKIDSIPNGVFPLSRKRILLDYENSYTVLNTQTDIREVVVKGHDFRIYKTLWNETTDFLVVGPKKFEEYPKNIEAYFSLSLYELSQDNKIALKGADLPRSFVWNPSEGYFIDGNTVIAASTSAKLRSFYPETNTLLKWDTFSTRSDLSLYESLSLHKTGFFTYHNGVGFVTLHLDPSYQNPWLELYPQRELKHRDFLENGNVLTIYQVKNNGKYGMQLLLQDADGVKLWESEFIKSNYNEEIAISAFYEPEQSKVYLSVGPLYYDENKDTVKYVFNLENKAIEKINYETGILHGTSFSYYNNSNGFSNDNTVYVFPDNGERKIILEQTVLLLAMKNDQALILDTNLPDVFSLSSFDGSRFKPKFTYNIGSSYKNNRYHPFLYVTNKSLIAGVLNNKVKFWKLDKQNPVKEIILNKGKAVHLAYAGNRLLVYYENGYIDVIDIESLEIILSIAMHQDENNLSSAYFSKDLNFYVPKDILNEYHFVKNGKVLPLSSYELFLNRPDIFIENLGYADESTVRVYKEAYLKRLKRNGYSEKTDYLNLSRPNLIVKQADGATKVQVEETYTIEVTVNDALDKLLIFNNGVPVEEKKSVDVGTYLFETVLTTGDNKIIVYGINSNGIESEPQNIIVTLDTVNTDQNPKVYYVGIGVSDYKDTSWNLKYADVDVRSIANKLKARYKSKLAIDTLTNRSVTIENLKRLKENLLKTNVNDIVILSFSGHGTVDESNDFYFGTYDIDFENPSERGFSYENMEWLLTDIPARRKLLLLDACHSGEIEDGEILETEDTSLNNNVTSYTPKGGKTYRRNDDNGLKNSFELMQSLFFDTERGNGSVVISAAGGKEFAFESKEWNNGVFTYSFLKALEDLSVEKGESDGIIRVSELKRYIYESVTNLTKGKQRPTARAENVEWDWELTSNPHNNK